MLTLINCRIKLRSSVLVTLIPTHCEDALINSIKPTVNAAWKGGIQFGKHIKTSVAKRAISIFVNLRYMRLKLLQYKENSKKIRDIIS